MRENRKFTAISGHTVRVQSTRSKLDPTSKQTHVNRHSGSGEATVKKTADLNRSEMKSEIKTDTVRTTNRNTHHVEIYHHHPRTADDMEFD
jgi:hypothetical protein